MASFILVAVPIFLTAIDFQENSAFWENLHWTLATWCMTYLGFLGWRSASGDIRRIRGLMTLGLLSYSIGQILWDIQWAGSYSEFPALSDIFYLGIAPFFAAGLAITFQNRISRGDRLAWNIDSVIVFLGLATIIFASYGLRSLALSIPATLVLVAYPVIFLALGGTALLGALTVRSQIRLVDSPYLLLLGLFLSGVCWVIWNDLALNQVIPPGNPISYGFSFSHLIVGLGVAVWNSVPSGNSRFNVWAQRILWILPIVIIPVTVLAMELHASDSEIIRRLIVAGGMSVITLAVIRQSILLMNRDMLVAREHELLERAEHELAERIRAEETVRQSEERFRDMAENIQEIFYLSDLTTPSMLYISPAYESIWGRSCQSLYENPTSFLDGVHPEDKERVLAYLEHQRWSNGAEEEYRVVRADGTLRWVWDRSFPLRDLNGNVNRMCGVVQDITRRKRVEQALKVSEETAREFQEKLRILHEVNLELSKVESLDDLYRAVVEMGLRRLGFERLALFMIDGDKEYLRGTFGTDETGQVRDERHLREEINAPSNRHLMECLRSQSRSVRLENTMLRGGGRELGRTGWNVLAIVWDGFHSVGILAIDNFLNQRPIQPFTEDLLLMYGNIIGHLITRIRNLQALQKSEDQYRIITELMSDYIFKLNIDPRGNVTMGYLSENYQAITGRTMDQIRTTEMWDSIIHPDDLGVVMSHLRQILTTHQEKELECRSFVKEGMERWINIFARPLVDQERGVVTEIIGSVKDITERKRAEQALRESEARYRTLAQNLPNSALLLYDQDLRFLLADGPEIEATGFSRKMLEGKTLHEALPAEFSQLVEPNMRRTLAGENFHAELPYEDRFYRYSYVPLRDKSGDILRAMILATNITERKRMEDALFEEKERAEITLQSIGDAVITTDVQARVEYLNPVAESMTGWTLREAVGQPLSKVFQIIGEENRQTAPNPVERCLREDRIVGLANHTVLIRRDGREFSIDDSAAPIRNRNGEVIGVVLVFHDVTEARRLSQKVAHDAMHDSLTGLVNRREFERRLERAMINSKENLASHILCYMDLDQFKIVNDTAGHAAGDELLIQVTKLLSGSFRQRDTFARLGGDEFGLLLENCELDHALVICNEILTKTHEFPFVWEGHGFRIGVSIGIVPITAQTESVAQLLGQADVACYTAKDLGRGRCYVYHPKDSETTQRHDEIIQAARLHEALASGHFRLFCQPIVQSGAELTRFNHYEILLRLRTDEEGLVLPNAFIPSAERYGVMAAIDRWVIRQTFSTISQSQVTGMEIAINLSGNSLDNENLLEYVLEQLHEFSIPPEQICFEITETAAIHHLSKAQHFIEKFRELGGKIALDDFGSGFSSFRYLKTLPVDYMKIDGSFVSDMLTSTADMQMVLAITQVAHTLGIKIIAEHASDLETISHLQEIGVEYTQGFGIGFPIPVEDAWGGKS